MEPSKEEIAGALVWSFVEQVREREVAGEPVAFSRAELDDLLELLHTAGAVPAATAGDCPDAARQEAVRARLDAVVAKASPARTPQPAGRTEHRRQRWQPSAWATSAAFGLASVFFVALATVSFWHRPSPVVQRVPVMNASVHPLDESRAHAMIPQMVHNELNPQDEKDLMGHLLVCRGCFDRYFHEQHGETSPQAAREDLLKLVSR